MKLQRSASHDANDPVVLARARTVVGEWRYNSVLGPHLLLHFTTEPALDKVVRRPQSVAITGGERGPEADKLVSGNVA